MKLASWHAAQPPVTPVWIWTLVGAGVANAVPGAVLVADAPIIPAGMLARWQLSQVVDDGMCEPAPGGAVGGMPTIALTPANVPAVPAGTWQLAQSLAMPAWFICEPLNFALLPTGSVLMLEPAPT